MSPTRTKTLTKQVVVRLEPEMYDALVHMSEGTDRTVALTVRWLLRGVISERAAFGRSAGNTQARAAQARYIPPEEVEAFLGRPNPMVPERAE